MSSIAANGCLHLPQRRVGIGHGGVNRFSSIKWRDICDVARRKKLWCGIAHCNTTQACFKRSFDSPQGESPSSSPTTGEEESQTIGRWIAPAIFAIVASTSGRALASTLEKSLSSSSSSSLSVALVSAWTGLLAGGLHTLTGIDHLAALAPLCLGHRSKLESAAIGAVWGCGHDAGHAIFGFLFLLLKDKLKIQVLRTWGARAVGLTLLAIGAMGIKEAQQSSLSLDEEDGGGGDEEKKKRSLGVTFATGFVYGLQPDALLMILPALAMPSGIAGVAFLAMFMVGTVAAMSSYTVFLASCSQALQERVPWITRKLSWVSSLVAIGFGFALLLGETFGFVIS